MDKGTNCIQNTPPRMYKLTYDIIRKGWFCYSHPEIDGFYPAKAIPLPWVGISPLYISYDITDGDDDDISNEKQLGT